MSVIREFKIAEITTLICEKNYLNESKLVLKNYRDKSEKFIGFLSENFINTTEKSGVLSKKVISLFEYLGNESLLKEENYKLSAISFDEINDLLNEALHELPSVKIEKQDKERFLTNKDDSILLKAKKSIKKISYKVTLNNASIKSKLKKQTFNRDQYFWNRKVELVNFVRYYITIPFINELKLILQEKDEKILTERFRLYFSLVEVYSQYLKYEENKENSEKFIESIKNTIAQQKELIMLIDKQYDEIELLSKSKLEQLIKSAEEIYPKAATIDLPNKIYGESPQNKIVKKSEKYSNKRQSQIKNFNKAISAKWISFFHLTLANLHLIQEFNFYKINLNKAIKENIESLFDQFRSELNKIITEIKNNEDGLDKVINKQRNELSESLNEKIIDELAHRIALDNPHSFIIKMEDILFKEIANLPSEILIVKNDNIDLKIRDKDFQLINPREIVEAELGSEYHSKILKYKNEVDAEVKKFSSKLIEVAQIIDYNLETAISILDNNEADTIEHAKNAAVEGIERAVSRSKNLFDKFDELKNDTIKKIDSLIKSFAAKIDELKIFENLFKLKLKVSKSKAEERVKDVIKNGVSNVKYFVPILLRKSRFLYTFTKNKLTTLGLKVGISEQKQALSVELTDFLLKTEEQIKKLPSVYQRLFSKNAIQDDRFVVGRAKEIDKIIKSYEYWKSGKKSSIVIVGEKGNGNSTLVFSALKKFTNNHKTINLEISNTIETAEQLFDLITSNLGIVNCKTESQLVAAIKNLPESSVFVIENIEGMFLRVVNGFEPIKTFSRIVTATNSKILWICTCNVYSWNYLDKVIRLSDYFQTVLRMGNISSKEIQEVILNRHAISGYDLEFLLPQNPSKKLLNLSKHEQQELLKEEFFEKLHSFANGNLRLSHLFWLRSIKELEGEKIEINSLSDMNFSFLKELNDKKLFALMAMILHDGITIEECSKIFNISRQESDMLISSMVDDGITIETVDGYKVNFLLYSVVIKLLHDKNIIH